MVNKHYHQLPRTSITTLALQNNLKGTSFHISIDSSELHVSPEYLLNFLSNLYIPPILNFDVQIAGKSFCLIFHAHSFIVP